MASVLQVVFHLLSCLSAVVYAISPDYKQLACDVERMRTLLHRYGEWMVEKNATDAHPFTLLNFDEPTVSYRPTRKKGTVIAGQTICTNNDRRLHEDPLMHRSICPWYWRINHDPNRIPEAIPEAVCKCPRAETGRNGPLYECEPVKSQLRVLMLNQCDEPIYTTISISVACATVPQGDQYLNRHVGVEFHVVNGNKLPVIDIDTDYK